MINFLLRDSNSKTALNKASVIIRDTVFSPDIGQHRPPERTP
jgi:hypothetical protein